ncbi:hypothetical protein PIB30_046387 [Stylosanthes scabra]|uniref:Transposase MuDR plant domain-containing protein n=1 Tax=Stylosanthes scabra TaxID=79078 RepID=A0ABU6RH70_9FABA|nr:hypothetical protein [Stylosanthes scabra]
MGRDADGICFRSVNPVVFQMQPVNTLEELKSAILRNMGAVGTMLVRRVAYRPLNIFPPNLFKFKIFWVDSDEHVCAMFELHRRYGTREVMELLTEMQTVHGDAGGSTSSSQGGPVAIPTSPIHFVTPEVSDEESDEDFVGNMDDSSESSDGSDFVPKSQMRRGFLLPAPAPIPDLSSVGSHFHMLHLDDMEEESMEGFGGGGEDYDIDGEVEFRVGHRFNTQEAVHRGVKNYNIMRACEYRVVKSDPYKYVCRCKQYDAGCTWSLRLDNIVGIAYKQGGAEVWGTTRLFGTVNVLRSRAARWQTDMQLHLADNKGQSFRAHSSLAICPSTELLLCAVLQECLYFWDGTTVDLQVGPYYQGDLLDHESCQFDKVFWRFSSLIEGVKYCKPFVSVDGTHLYGIYGGVLLMAVV